MTDRLDVGAVIRRVFDIYVDQAPVLLPASAVVFVITGIVSTLLVAAASGLAVVAALLILVAKTLFTGMVVELVADVQDGRRDHSAGELLRAATPVLGQLILVGIVYGVGIVVGFVLFIVPGLILLTIWSVAAPVVVLERPGVFAALGRSRELVRGNGWQVFGVIFILYFLVGIVGFGIGLAAESAGTGVWLVANVVIGVLTGPLAALAAAVLYFELRGTRVTAVTDPPIGGASPDEPVARAVEAPQRLDLPEPGDGVDPPPAA
jgi:ABC-type multidrug transport system fused ATPase/permease subunit